MTCPDCGSKVYGGHCVNCHEETYIFQQNYENDKEDQVAFSDEFMGKVEDQKKEAVKILANSK